MCDFIMSHRNKGQTNRKMVVFLSHLSIMCFVFAGLQYMLDSYPPYLGCSRWKFIQDSLAHWAAVWWPRVSQSGLADSLYPSFPPPTPLPSSYHCPVCPPSFDADDVSGTLEKKGREKLSSVRSGSSYPTTTRLFLINVQPTKCSFWDIFPRDFHCMRMKRVI